MLLSTRHHSDTSKLSSLATLRFLDYGPRLLALYHFRSCTFSMGYTAGRRIWRHLGFRREACCRPTVRGTLTEDDLEFRHWGFTRIFTNVSIKVMQRNTSSEFCILSANYKCPSARSRLLQQLHYAQLERLFSTFLSAQKIDGSY